LGPELSLILDLESQTAYPLFC